MILSGDLFGETLTQNQKQILELIAQNNFITAIELAEKVHISKRKMEENMAKLKQKGLLKRVGPAKGGHWEIQ